jgi:hypothetical protein
VIAGEAAGRAGELAGVVPVEELADRAPFVAALDDGIADFQERGRFGMPEARGGETAPGLEVKIEARGVDVLATMRKAHGDVPFVGTLVGREASVAVDAEKGSANAARIGDEVRRDFVQRRGEVGDEADRGFAGVGFVFVLVRLEPFALVVALETSEEAEEIGSKVRGHDRLRYWARGGNVKPASKTRIRRKGHEVSLRKPLKPSLLVSVFAGWGIQAGIGQAESFDWLTCDDVGVDDLVDVGFGNVSVPDGVGVDDDVRAVLALIEASGLVGADAAFQSTLGEFLLEKFLEPGFGGGIATSAGMACGALVSADEDVFFEFRH